MHPAYPPELLRFVQQELASGAYTSEDELLLDGVRLLCQLKLRYDQLRAEVSHAIAQADRGETAPMDIEAIKSEGRRLLAHVG